MFTTGQKSGNSLTVVENTIAAGLSLRPVIYRGARPKNPLDLELNPPIYRWAQRTAVQQLNQIPRAPDDTADGESQGLDP